MERINNHMIDCKEQSMDIFAKDKDYPAEIELQDEEARKEKKYNIKKGGMYKW